MAKKSLPIALERHEAMALLEAVHLRYPSGIRNRAILEVMLHAGFRISEVMALRPGHIRWKVKILEVHKGKGGRDRNIPVDSETIRRLRDWQAVRPKGVPYFFCTRDGGKLCARYIQLMVKRMARRAGLERIKQITPHVLRHTYATNMLDDGFTVADVQRLLGHSALSTTSIYLHVRPSELAEKIQKRRALIESKPDKGALELAERIARLPGESLELVVKLVEKFEKGI